MPFCRALNLRWSVIGRIAKALIYSKLVGNSAQLAVVMRSLNSEFTAAVSRMTRKEVEKSLIKEFNGDKWYCFVRDPITARKSAQANALGIFRTAGDKFELKSPLSFTYQEDVT